jgi:hypothetical protein
MHPDEYVLQSVFSIFMIFEHSSISPINSGI